MKFTLRAIARAYLMSIGFWWCIALMMGLQYRPLHRQNFWPSLLSLLMEVTLRSLAFASWTPPIFYLVGKYLNPTSSRIRYILAWSLGAVPFIFLHATIFWVLVPPYDNATQKYLPRSFHSWADMIRYGFADLAFIYIAIVVAAHAYQYLKRLRTQERERYEYQQALAASELQALKMQLHPHFLFNTLHGIATLIEGEPKNAKAMIIKLSNLLRTALDRDSSDLISLQEELKFAKEYLDLEKMRFGDRLKIQWLIASETLRMLVPQMILQPLVENGIRHGVASRREGGWIEVAARTADGILNIEVRNSTSGRSSNGTGVGLRNVEARLKYLYSGDAHLKFSLADDHTATVSLTLPVLSSQQAEQARNPQTALGRENSLCEYSSSMTNL